jgi:NAD(P)-dependent dehydrogenase (short-subunit alcohol dehydrogenase family)
MARRIVVVGGTSGIGLATARCASAKGAEAIVLCGRSIERGERARTALALEFPRLEVSFIPCDAADPHDADRALEKAAQTLGHIDALVSCAGGDVYPRLLADTPTAEVMAVVSSIMACVVLPARAAYSVMRSQGNGAIVCVASDAGKIATPGESVIGAAMAGIAMFCRGMAIEAKREGIRINCVTPSIVQGTSLYERLQDNALARRLFAKAESLAGLGVVSADDVAELITFLIDPASSKVTGQTVSVTGGISAA